MDEDSFFDDVSSTSGGSEWSSLLPSLMLTCSEHFGHSLGRKTEKEVAGQSQADQSELASSGCSLFPWENREKEEGGRGA